MKLFARINMLVTGRAVWVSTDGSVEVIKEPWSIRWAIAGVHLPSRLRLRLGLDRTVSREDLDWG